MKIQWNGQGQTLVRVDMVSDKMTLGKGDAIEVSEKRGKELLRYSKDFVVVTGDVKKEHVEHAQPEVQREIQPVVQPEVQLSVQDEIQLESKSKKKKLTK